MDIREELYEERKRLTRLGVSISIFCVLISTWARDPLINIELPLGGAKIENLTAGHAVLLGFPVVTFLILWLAGQAMRVDGLYQSLNPEQRKASDWRVSIASVKPRWVSAVVSRAAIATRYFVIVLLPFVASLVLFTSYFDLRKCEENDRACSQGKEVTTLAFFFSTELWEVRPSYIGLNPKVCKETGSGCDVVNRRNKVKEEIRRHIPYVYAPLQSWIYSLFQALNVIAFLFLTSLYFRRSSR